MFDDLVARQSHPEAPLDQHGDPHPGNSGVRTPLTVGVEPNALPAAGTLLGERYVVGRSLGRGAMGVVFEGVHRDLGERVAIKLLLPEHLENAELVARFAREARAAAKLRGEHVARVLDVGRHDERFPYIVMEYLDGEDLAQLVERLGPLPVADACAYLIEACAGLAEAHARGIVHRDVKPENLFHARATDGRRRVKILDFGVSKVALTGSAVPDADLAATSTMLGTPLYMSPEQIRSRAVDHRSDIWSLGVVLYELLSGRTPFLAGNIAELVGRVLEEPPLPLRALRPELPEALEAVVMRCLARDPSWRWPSVASLAVALLPFAPRASRSVAEQACGHIEHADSPASFPDLPGLPAAAPSLPPPPSVAATSPDPGATLSTPAAARTVPPLGSPDSALTLGRLWLVAGVLGILLVVAVGALLSSPREPKAAARRVAGVPLVAPSAAAVDPADPTEPPVATTSSPPSAPPAPALPAVPPTPHKVGRAHRAAPPTPPASPPLPPRSDIRLVR